MSANRPRVRPAALQQPGPPRPSSVLDALNAEKEEIRPLTLMLHWAMTSLEAHWAAMYHLEGGKLRRVAKTSEPAKMGQVVRPPALFDFMTEDDDDMGAKLAMRAVRAGTTIASSSKQDLLSGSALATPLLDEDGQAVGCVVLLCVDEKRGWSAEQQQQLAYAAPMFTLHAQRSRMQEQAAWLAGLDEEDAMAANYIAQRVGKAVSELKLGHAAQLARQKEDFDQQRGEAERAHAKALALLQAEILERDEKLGAAQALLYETSQGLMLRMQGELRAKEEEFEAELARLRQDAELRKVLEEQRIAAAAAHAEVAQQAAAGEARRRAEEKAAAEAEAAEAARMKAQRKEAARIKAQQEAEAAAAAAEAARLRAKEEADAVAAAAAAEAARIEAQQKAEAAAAAEKLQQQQLQQQQQQQQRRRRGGPPAARVTSAPTTRSAAAAAAGAPPAPRELAPTTAADRPDAADPARKWPATAVATAKPESAVATAKPAVAVATAKPVTAKPATAVATAKATARATTKPTAALDATSPTPKPVALPVAAAASSSPTKAVAVAKAVAPVRAGSTKPATAVPVRATAPGATPPAAAVTAVARRKPAAAPVSGPARQ